jgi:hypothetical protein
LDLKLTIDANYESASKAFQELANSSEATREKIEKFASSFQSEHLDKFIDKQKLLEVSLKGTRGEVASMTTAQKNYEKEIERLIRSGLDPESDAIQKLRNEHDKLANKIKETNEVQKSQEQLMKGAEKATLAAFAAIGAGVAAIGVATQKMAEAGDQFAKTSRIIGMTAETFQELDYAAKMSGIDNLEGSLQKLNKSVADVKSGTGSLTSYLKENDKQLLNQLQNVNSNEEAFDLLMDAIGKAPDEFTKAGLAQAAFGKSGQDLILLAHEGADGIASLREEAKKYGVISNEAAANSETYLDAQARLKAALSGVSNELTAGLLPGLTETITKIADFIAGIDNWEQILSVAAYALAGVTAGLVAFLVVAKGAAILNVLTTAFHGLTAAIAANPIGAIAVLITAVLIPALIALYNNWDTVSTYLQQGIARIEYGFKWLGSQIKEKFVTAVNSVKIAFMSLVDTIQKNVLGAVAKLLEVMGKLPFVGEMFQKASDSVNNFSRSISGSIDDVKAESQALIDAAHAEQDATEASLKNKLSSIDAEAQARRAAIEEQKKQNEEVVEDEKQTQEQLNVIRNEAINGQLKTLAERLNEIPLTEKQIQTQQIEQFKSFLQERMDLELTDDENRVEWLEEQKELLFEQLTLEGEEKVALEKTFNDMILEEDKKLKDAQQKLMNEKLQATGTFFKGIEDLASLASNKSIELLIIEKAAASAQAAINSYLAFTNALATVPYPFNYVAAAGVLASGIAQQIKIMSTAIPSAETGGRFIVPNSVGSDSSLMRVNSGEEVEVTPRGMTGFNKAQNIIVQIEKQTIFDVINDGIRSGDVLISAANF